MSAAAAAVQSDPTDPTPTDGRALGGLPFNPDPSPDEHARRREIARAWKAYRGQYPDVFKVAAGQPNDNIRANRCAAIVDKGVSWLFGQIVDLEPRLADDDGTADMAKSNEGSTAAAGAGARGADASSMKQFSAALAHVWGSPDDMLVTLGSLAMNGANAGHAFLKIVFDSDRMQYPRLVVLDSANVFVTTDPDDCNRAIAYTIEYRADLGASPNGQRRTVTKRQVIALVDPDGNARLFGGADAKDYWTITNFLRFEATGAQANSTASAASLAAAQAPWMQHGETVEWRFPFPPIVDCMNLLNPNEYYGLSDLPPELIDMCERLHFVESNIAKIIKSHAHPWVFASGCDPSSIVNEPGRVQGLASENAKVWAVQAQGDLDASMRFANELRADMDEQSRVPAVALGRQESLPKGNISGVALQLLFQPLIEKTEQKRRLYGQLIRKVSQYALVLLGLVEDCDDIEIHVKWPNLLPVDDLAAAQTAQLLTQVGVSTQTVMAQLGYDPDEEAEKSEQDAQRQQTKQTRGQAQPQAPANIQLLQQRRMAAANAAALAGGGQQSGSAPSGIAAQAVAPPAVGGASGVAKA